MNLSEIQRVFCILPGDKNLKKINHLEDAESIDFT